MSRKLLPRSEQQSVDQEEKIANLIRRQLYISSRMLDLSRSCWLVNKMKHIQR